MRGCRALTKEEINQLPGLFTGAYKKRNMGLFFLGTYTGFRVTELLSLTLDHVLEPDDSLKDRVQVKSTATQKELRRLWSLTGITITKTPPEALRTFKAQTILPSNITKKMKQIY